MLTSSRPFILALATVFLAGCATNNNSGQPQQQGGDQGQGIGKTATYGGLGALAGAAAGALLNKDNRGKGALIGAAVGGAAGAGYGYYVDKQEAELRQQMAGTGVEVQRQGDQLTLVMPGNITFATGSADISSAFYTPLNSLANSIRQYNQNSSIEVIGYTDNTGSYQNNVALSQRRAQSVVNYLVSQGVDGTRVMARGAGPENPIASNANEAGRSQNRRVEVKLTPLPQQQQQYQQYPQPRS